MPLINVKLIDGVFSPAQKKEIARKLTGTMVSIEGEAMRSVTWVVVEEVKGGDWAIGGQTLTTQGGQLCADGADRGVRGAGGPARFRSARVRRTV
jgi:4-oxalocrotonate tautomerase